jgi:ADP-heptose:LPS heptosyltransferase
MGEIELLRYSAGMRIVVVRDDKLGDSILTTPLISGLSCTVPGANITAVCESMTRDVFAYHPGVAGTVIQKPFPTVWEGIRWGLSLRKCNPDAVLLTRRNGRAYTIGALLSGARQRISAVDPAKWYARLLTSNTWSVFNQRVNTAEHFLALGDCLTGSTIPRTPCSVFAGCSSSCDFDAGAGKPYIVLHLGTGGANAPWFPAHYEKVACSIVKDFGIQVVLTGANCESSLASRVAGKTGVISCVGCTSLRELAEVMRKAQAVVGVTTGAMHVASAVQTPSVVLFPKLSGDPVVWGPWMAPHRVVQPQSYCAGCTTRDCRPVQNECIESLTPESVLKALYSLLHEKEPDFMARSH